MLLLHLRPTRRLAWSGWLLVLAARRPGGRRRRPPQARLQLLGHDLVDLPALTASAIQAAAASAGPRP
jgi:hypothetical protein